MIKFNHRILLLFFIPIVLSGCNKDKVAPLTPDDGVFTKRDVLYKGISYESPSSAVDGTTFDPMLSVNGNSVSIIPFGFVYSGDSVVNYNSSFQWWGESDEGVIELINFAHARNLKVMMKPQVWLMGGQFTGTFDMNSESQWQALEDSYRDYILHFTDIADSMGCDMVSIGTEFANFVSTRPIFWDNLIDSTRAHFSGSITYAENWDAFDAFPFWDQLDFIGIDAYFPVSMQETPSVEDCMQGWRPHLDAIESVHNQTGVPVILTEYGYRSINNCGEEPWDSSNGGVVNLEAQVNAYLGLYYSFWDKPWFEGGFIWKWSADHANSGGTNNNRFTPQNKPAEQTLQFMYE